MNDRWVDTSAVRVIAGSPGEAPAGCGRPMCSGPGFPSPSDSGRRCDHPIRSRALGARRDESRLVREARDLGEPRPALVAITEEGEQLPLTVVRGADAVEALMPAIHVTRATRRGNADSRAAPRAGTKFPLGVGGGVEGPRVDARRSLVSGVRAGAPRGLGSLLRPNGLRCGPARRHGPGRSHRTSRMTSDRPAPDGAANGVAHTLPWRSTWRTVRRRSLRSSQSDQLATYK